MSTFKTNKLVWPECFTTPRGLSSALLCLCIVTALGSAGCRRSSDDAQPASAASSGDSSPEQPWVQQVEQVRSGASDEIRLERRAVSSAELEQLAGLSKLRTLILDAGSVRNEDVSALQGLNKLEHLRLRASPLTDDGLSELSRCGLESLVILNLPQASPTAEGLRALRRLPRVRQLRIAGKQIDNAAVEELARWPELTSLHLIGPNLTDHALETIASMSKLSSFYLDDCTLSDSAWEKLFQARPTLHVHIDQAHHDRDPSADH